MTHKIDNSNYWQSRIWSCLWIIFTCWRCLSHWFYTDYFLTISALHVHLKHLQVVKPYSCVFDSLLCSILINLGYVVTDFFANKQNNWQQYHRISIFTSEKQHLSLEVRDVILCGCWYGGLEGRGMLCVQGKREDTWGSDNTWCFGEFRDILRNCTPRKASSVCFYDIMRFGNRLVNGESFILATLTIIRGLAMALQLDHDQCLVTTIRFHRNHSKSN